MHKLIFVLIQHATVHGSSGALSVASDAQSIQHSNKLIPSISCRSTVSDTEYENVRTLEFNMPN